MRSLSFLKALTRVLGTLSALERPFFCKLWFCWLNHRFHGRSSSACSPHEGLTPWCRYQAAHLHAKVMPTQMLNLMRKEEKVWWIVIGREESIRRRC